MTFYEYDLRMTAFRLSNLDSLYHQCEGALVNRAVKATDKKGKKYIIKKPNDYINFDKEEKNILGVETLKEKQVDRELINRIAKMNQRGG